MALKMLELLSVHPLANFNWQVFFVEILYTMQVPTLGPWLVNIWAFRGKTSVYCCFEYVLKSENVNNLSKKNLVQSSVKFLNELKGCHHIFLTLSSGYSKKGKKSLLRILI